MKLLKAAVKREAHPKHQTQLTLSLPADELSELRTELSEAVAENRELRVEATNEKDTWIIYFKRRDGGSRVQLAHPALHEWVATLSLASEHVDRFQTALAALTPGQTARLSDAGSLGSFANIDLVVARASE